MSKSSNNRLFISYAWKDDQPFVERLYNDLLMLGYDAWMDKKNMPSRGRSLPREVEEQLQARDRVIAVMGPESIVSDACQAERAFAFNTGKVVIAILRLGDYKMLPAQLSQYFVPDFRVSRSYEEAFDELKRVLQAPPVIPGQLFDVPALPLCLQRRPDEFLALREFIMAAELKEATVITSTGHVGLLGMGGVGKTVMATLAARDYMVRCQFQNGIIWLTFGRQPNILRQVQKALAALGHDDTKYDELSLARMQLGQVLEGKECLLILDDVWSAADAEPFVRAINPRCRLLITTRVLDVVGALGARAYPLDVMTIEQSRDLLAQRSRCKPNALPPEADDIMKECGYLPLALAMTGAMLREKPSIYWKRVLKLLRGTDIDKIRAQFPDYPHTSLLRAIQVSVDALDPQGRERYLALAFMLEDMPIHPVIQQILWGVDELDALDIAENFVNHSLAQRNGDDGSILLHDLQLDYVRAQFNDRDALDLIHGAALLFLHIVDQDPWQYSSQMVGRLLSHQGIQAVQQFTNRLIASTRRPWLRPLQPALEQSGSACVCTLVGHSAAVSDVATDANWRIAVSASVDHMMKVWDLNKGRELHTLNVRSDGAIRLAVSADGRRAAVSNSSSDLLDILDLDKGQVLFTLQVFDSGILSLDISGDGGRVILSNSRGSIEVWDTNYGDGCPKYLARWTGLWEPPRMLQSSLGSDGVLDVSISADGSRALSACTNGTLKLWNLAAGKEFVDLRDRSGWKPWTSQNIPFLEGDFGTFSEVLGHPCWVAISKDGKRAISCSENFGNHSINILEYWDLESAQAIGSPMRIPSSAHSVAISGNGKRAVISCEDFRLRFWDADAAEELKTLAGHSGAVNSAAISRDGRYAVSASDDHTLRIWDLNRLHGSGDYYFSIPFSAGIVVSGHGSCVISAFHGENLKLLDLDSGRELRTLNIPSRHIAISSNGRRAVSGTDKNTLTIWNLEYESETRTVVDKNQSHYHENWPDPLAISGDGRRAITVTSTPHDVYRGGSRVFLNVWDLESGEVLHRFFETNNSQTYLLVKLFISGDGRRAVTWCEFDVMRVWDLDSGKQLRIVGDRITDIAVSDDGRLAISSYVRTLKLWDLENGHELRNLGEQTSEVRAIGLSANGQLAASISSDKMLRVWNLKTGNVMSTFTCDASPELLAFAGNRRILVRDLRGQVHFFSVELNGDS